MPDQDPTIEDPREAAAREMDKKTAETEFKYGQRVTVERSGQDGAPNYMEDGWQVVYELDNGSVLVRNSEGAEKYPSKELLRSWQDPKNDERSLNPEKPTAAVPTPEVSQRESGEPIVIEFLPYQKVRVLRDGATEPEEGWEVVSADFTAEPPRVLVRNQSGITKNVRREKLIAWQSQ
ncbi:MAG: hypothetical protein WC052_02460 [Patescibacteria group bacterium]|jgi:hypothetical protein